MKIVTIGRTNHEILPDGKLGKGKEFPTRLAAQAAALEAINKAAAKPVSKAKVAAKAKAKEE
jgi:hypothetical protein